jgi:hypothetical protein
MFPLCLLVKETPIWVELLSLDVFVQVETDVAVLHQNKKKIVGDKRTAQINQCANHNNQLDLRNKQKGSCVRPYHKSVVSPKLQLRMIRIPYLMLVFHIQTNINGSESVTYVVHTKLGEPKHVQAKWKKLNTYLVKVGLMHMGPSIRSTLASLGVHHTDTKRR